MRWPPALPHPEDLLRHEVTGAAIAACLSVLATAAYSGSADVDARLDTPVSNFSFTGNLEDAVQVLGKQGNVALKTAKDTRDLLLFVHVDNQPLRQVMSQIASALGVEWREEQQLTDPLPRYVARLSDSAAAQRAKIRKAKMAQLKFAKAWAKGYQDLLDLPENDRNAAAQEGLSQMRDQIAHHETEQNDVSVRSQNCLELTDPALPIVVGIIGSWSDKEWSRLVDDGYLVYCSSPKPAQTRLPNDSLALALSWLPAIDAQHNQLEDTDTKLWSTRGEVTLKLKTGFISSATMNATGIEPKTCIYKARFYYDSKSLEASFEALNQQRDTIAESRTWRISLTDTGGPDDGANACSANPLFDRKLAIPDEVVRVGQRSGFCEQYQKWLHEPAKHDFVDPLAVFAGPVLRDVSHSLGMPAVVALTDEQALGNVSTNEEIRQCLSSIAKKILSFDITDGWLIGRVRSSIRAQTALDNNCSRPPLRKMYRLASSSAHPDIASLAEFVCELSDGQVRTARLPLEAFFPKCQFDWDARAVATLRLFGSLNTPHREILRNGATLRGLMLNASETGALVKYLASRTADVFTPLWHTAWTRFDCTEVSSDVLPRITVQMKFLDERLCADWLSESRDRPTPLAECLVPADAYWVSLLSVTFDQQILRASSSYLQRSRP